MPLTLLNDHCMADRIGPHGLRPKDYDRIERRMRDALERLRVRYAAGRRAFLDLPFDGEGLATAQAAAMDFEGAENLLLAGIGGSALGPAAIFGALCHPLHNLLPARARGNRPRFFVLDNVDPDLAAAQLEFCDPATTVYNIVSKSGSTAETAAATLLILGRVKETFGRGWQRHVICTTDPADGDLRALCEREGIPTLTLPAAIGGRFSVLSPVGLFPAAMLGIDVEEMLDGAAAMALRCVQDDLDCNPAAQMAAALFMFDTQRQKPIHVMMAYANSLYLLADWFRQLWAESLGKARDLHGREVHVGPTPVKALGTTDQHSQVQLYIEGPFDKVFIFLEAERFRNELELPTVYGEVSSLGYLGGKTMNQLMAAELAATREALARQGRPSMTIRFPEINARSVGEFFMLLEITTALCGHLYHVNPFDQPGVELGKILTYGLMGRAGFEEHARGITLPTPPPEPAEAEPLEETAEAEVVTPMG